MMKLTELKRRLQVGIHLRLVNSLLGPCDKLRVVDGYDTVDVWFTGDGIKQGSVSHLRWPRASELRETPRGFEILEGGEVAAAYEWVDILVGDLGGDLVSLTGTTDAGRAWLLENVPYPEGTEHEVLGALAEMIRAAGLAVSVPVRVQREVDAQAKMLAPVMALIREREGREADFEVEDHGSLDCVQPLTAKATAWLTENLDGGQTWLGGGLMVERAYSVDLVIAMRDAGLVERKR